MRKWCAILLVAALVGVATGEARAAALEFSGELRARGWWLDNYLRNRSTTEFWDQRLRLGLQWPLAQNVQLRVRADILEGLWGDNDLEASLAVAGDPVTGAHTVTTTVSGTPPKQTIAFDWAHLQFVVPGTPLRLSLGRQDVSWGTGFWVQSDSRDRFEVAAKLDPVVIVFAYDKFSEVFLGHDTRDDQRGWAVGAVLDAAGFRFGLLAAYLEDESRIRFPSGDLSYVAGDVFVKGGIGPARVQAEVTYGGGTIDRGALGDLDAGGLGAYAGIFLSVGPLVSVGLEGAYARGDDPKTPGAFEGFYSADYQGPYWSVVFYNNLDSSGYAGDSQTSSAELDFSVRNAVTGKFSAVFTPLKKLSITGAALYAAADRTRDGVEKAMGWEFDLIAVFEIAENVGVTAGCGYALLGDYWKSAPVSGGTGLKPDNPLGAVVAFTTRF